jgi:hypothetical protein
MVHNVIYKTFLEWAIDRPLSTIPAIYNLFKKIRRSYYSVFIIATHSNGRYISPLS